MADHKLQALRQQCYEGVLYVNPSAPTENLFGVAERRLKALEDILCVLENHNDEHPLVLETSRIAAALAPLAGEALQLFTLAQEARDEDRR